MSSVLCTTKKNIAADRAFDPSTKTTIAVKPGHSSSIGRTTVEHGRCLHNISETND